MSKPEAIKSVAVVIFRGDEVLLVRNGPSSDHPTGKYGLPAGKVKVEVEESWEEAAIRECEEESGLKPERLVKLPTFYEAELERKDGPPRLFCCWSYYCPEYRGELKGSSDAEPIWVRISEIKELPLTVNVDRMIAEADLERRRV
jgi:ADP-ribose pyrophosphatase YjhB (NUDIX family)